MSTAEPTVAFNPLTPGFTENPYEHLAEVRASDPVQEFFGRWALFNYSDVFHLLRDPSLSVEDEKSNILETPRAQQFVQAAREAGRDPERKSMLSTDPPDHTRLRRLVTKAFTPRSIEQLRPAIQDLVDTALDQIEADGGGDVVSQLAFPLPFDVINLMLGMPEADKEQIKAWSGALVKTLDPILTEQEINDAMVAGDRMDDHIDAVIEWKRSNPADDMLSRLIAAEEDGDRLSATELRQQVILLFVAGHETTVNLIGTGIYELMRNPAQLALLRDQPDLEPNAVDELLRYITPVQFSRRIATADIEFSGEVVPARSFVMAILASANRDKNKFGDNADDLDITRPNAGQHVSFGSGTHYCLGASLAKLEAQVAIGSFVRRFPGVRLDGDAEWNGRVNLRGLEKLPIAVK